MRPVGEHSVAFATKQDWVAEIIRERIIVGAYRRSQQLKQADLAEELGVSITPVREALLTLEAEGYVRGLPHKGLVVPELVPELAREIYDLRLILERDLTARALELMTPAGLTDLLDLHRNLVRALASDDLQSVRTANYRFHFRLYEIAGRPQTLQFVRVLWAKYPFTAQDVKRGRPGRMRQEHELFLKKAHQGDRDEAVEAMLQHIANGWRQITDAVAPPAADKPKAPARRLVTSP
jgi:DNA-binding GntR family transcriptional regulator